MKRRLFAGWILLTVLFVVLAGGCNSPRGKATADADAATESVSYAEPVESSDALAALRVKRVISSGGAYSFEVLTYVGQSPPKTNIVACLATRSDCKMLKVGDLYYLRPVSDGDPAAYPKQISSDLRSLASLRLYCRGGSIVYFMADPRSSANATATNSDRTATPADNLAERDGIKVLSVKWRGPYSGSWVPTFVVRNDGPTVNLAKIDYQVFDGEVLVGSSSLYFNSGIPSNTTAKQEGRPFDSEGQPKIKVVDIWVQ